jgi:hypothetical protein
MKSVLELPWPTLASGSKGIGQEIAIAARHHAPAESDVSLDQIADGISVPVARRASPEAEQGFPDPAMADASPYGVDDAQCQDVMGDYMIRHFQKLPDIGSSVEETPDTADLVDAKLDHAVERQQDSVAQVVGRNVVEPDAMNDPAIAPGEMDTVSVITHDIGQTTPQHGRLRQPINVMQSHEQNDRRKNIVTPAWKHKVRRDIRVGREIATPSAGRSPAVGGLREADATNADNRSDSSRFGADSPRRFRHGVRNRDIRKEPGPANL